MITIYSTPAITGVIMDKSVIDQCGIRIATAIYSSPISLISGVSIDNIMGDSWVGIIAADPATVQT